MSIFDKLKNAAATAATPAAAAESKRDTFIFAALPESLAELQALPEASLDTPAKTAALCVLALCAYAADKATGTEMLNWLRGPRPLGGQDISFLDDRFRDGKTYLPFTYFAGATADNNYTPTQPYTVTVEENHTSAAEPGLQKAVHSLRRRGRSAPDQAAAARQRRQMVPVGAVSADRRAHAEGSRPLGITKASSGAVRKTNIKTRIRYGSRPGRGGDPVKSPLRLSFLPRRRARTSSRFFPETNGSELRLHTHAAYGIEKDSDRHVYYATSDSPYGPFTHEGPLVAINPDIREIDGHPFRDEDGKLYMSFSRYDRCADRHGKQTKNTAHPLGWAVFFYRVSLLCAGFCNRLFTNYFSSAGVALVITALRSAAIQSTFAPRRSEMKRMGV